MNHCPIHAKQFHPHAQRHHAIGLLTGFGKVRRNHVVERSKCVVCTTGVDSLIEPVSIDGSNRNLTFHPVERMSSRERDRDRQTDCIARLCIQQHFRIRIELDLDVPVGGVGIGVSECD